MMDYARTSGYYHRVANRKGPPVPTRNFGRENQGFQVPSINELTVPTETPEHYFKTRDVVTDAFTMGEMIPPMTTPEFRMPQIRQGAVTSQPRPGHSTLPSEFDESMIDSTSKELLKKVLREHKSHEKLEECLNENGRKMYNTVYQHYGSHHESISQDAMLANLVMAGEEALLDAHCIFYTSVEFLDQNGEEDMDCPKMRKGKALLTNQRLLLLSSGETADLSLYRLQKGKSKKSHSNKFSVETFCGDDLHLRTLPIEGFLSVEFHSSTVSKATTRIIGTKGTCSKCAKLCCFCFYCFCCCEIRSCMKHWTTDPYQVINYNDRYVTIGALIPPWAKRTTIKIHFDPSMSFTLINQFLLEMQTYAPNVNVVKLANWHREKVQPEEVY